MTTTPKFKPKVISFVNLKGGVGKTTLAVSYASYLGNVHKKRVLLVDLDPQTNASFWVMGFKDWKRHEKNKGTVADLMGATAHSRLGSNLRTVDNIVYKSPVFGFDLIPSNLSLYTMDLDLASVPMKEVKLKRAIEACKNPYDYIICDCPPNLTIPTQNALALSTHYVVPIALDYFSSIGISLLKSRIAKLGNDLDNHPKLAGIVITRAGSRPGWHKAETEGGLRKTFGAELLNSKIKDRQDVVVSTQDKTPVFNSGNQSVIQEFTGVCQELYGRIQ
ncbi:Cobyrinic acid ac-diamide synthase [Nitrospira sp. ND1]|uniref:ParA family protein n=1 Tax=Nitrospira sp. ND1 TaxID=1658518 RepID=UPI0009BACD32|nr:ParA family protein [Nitrospira sp. ND1]SLM43307.1 Cobyrinic acid ac-diamide synthase [Nitrospira sp. ND1]